ncbi:sensor histidine kinase [Streptomyces avicenniae]|uniref:sensor histidine kinase n=1 Tax=Streptomyces avicenniae TaxID=500153 RepID=UPI00069C52D2|nr:histidine kinase [Streptomyces avicenniae]
MNTSGEEAPAGGGYRLWWWTRRRSAALDIGLAVVSAAECVAQGLGFAERTGLPPALIVLLGVLAGSTVVVRRKRPLTVILVALAILPTTMGDVLAVVGLYTLATSEASRRLVGALAATEAVGSFLVTHLLLERDPGLEAQPMPAWFRPLVAGIFAVVLVAPPVLLGMYVRARRRLVESLRDRAGGLERELALLAERAEERAEWARGEERRRIAREMHDVVAHRVSLMVVHAAAVAAVAPKDPEQAARNATLIGDMGRQALTELRTMLGVLRAADKVPLAAPAPAAPFPPPVGSTAASAPPRHDPAGPALDGLGALIDQSRAAGMAVDLAVEGEPRGYAEPVESTAYRVVQEALTNVHKHAAGAVARVRLAHREGEVAVLVQNDAPAGGAVPGARLPSGGNGLVGMRERVMALGGGFVSGPTDGGGFRVSAVIPDRREPSGA